VALLGSLGSRSVSEKYSLRTRTGATFPSHGCMGGGSGTGDEASFDFGSGASAAAVIVASMRFGSFSPPRPVSTVRVTRRPETPAGGPVTMNSTRPPGGTPM